MEAAASDAEEGGTWGTKEEVGGDCRAGAVLMAREEAGGVAVVGMGVDAVDDEARRD